jgi:hypothetical protein
MVHGLLYISTKIYEVDLISDERKNRRYRFIQGWKVPQKVLRVDSE